MKNMKNFIASVKSLALKESGSKINQIQRNALKSEALYAIFSDLNGGTEIVRTLNGLVLVVPNDELGEVYLEIDLKVKNLDFDVEQATTEYSQTLAERVARTKAAAEKKAKALAKKAKSE